MAIFMRKDPESAFELQHPAVNWPLPEAYIMQGNRVWWFNYNYASIFYDYHIFHL